MYYVDYYRKFIEKKSKIEVPDKEIRKLYAKLKEKYKKEKKNRVIKKPFVAYEDAKSFLEKRLRIQYLKRKRSTESKVFLSNLKIKYNL